MDDDKNICNDNKVRQLCTKCVFIAVGVDPREHAGDECRGCAIIKNDGYYAAALESAQITPEPLTLERSQFESADSHIIQGEKDNVSSSTSKDELPPSPGCIRYLLMFFGFFIISTISSFISPKIAIQSFVFGALALVFGYLFSWMKRLRFTLKRKG